MKAFSFRLDRILRLKEEAEGQQARVMGEAARNEAVLDQICLDQAGYVLKVSDQAAAITGERTNAGKLRTRHLAAMAALRQLEEAERARVVARKLADVERVRLAEAQRERRTLERLKAHQRETWDQELVRDERKTMDEVAGRPRGATGR